MLKTIIAKEFLDNILNLRFIVGLILSLQRHLKIRALILFNLNKSDNDHNHLNFKLSKNNCRCRVMYYNHHVLRCYFDKRLSERKERLPGSHRFAGRISG